MGVDGEMIKEIKEYQLDKETTDLLIDMLNRKLYTIYDVTQDISACGYYGKSVTTKVRMKFGEFTITIEEEK